MITFMGFPIKVTNAVFADHLKVERDSTRALAPQIHAIGRCFTTAPDPQSRENRFSIS